MTYRQLINKIKKIFSQHNATFSIKENYHYASGFIQIPKVIITETEHLENIIIYVSILDDRMTKDISKHVLFRTAKDIKDFSGGHNNYFDIDDRLKPIDIFKRLYYNIQFEN